MRAALHAFLESEDGRETADYDAGDSEPWLFYWFYAARVISAEHWAAFGLSVEELTDAILVFDADENLAHFLNT